LYSRENIIEGKEKSKKMMILAIIERKAKNEKEKEKTN